MRKNKNLSYDNYFHHYKSNFLVLYFLVYNFSVMEVEGWSVSGLAGMSPNYKSRININ